MVEAMVAAALFSVAIVGMTTLMERQNAARGGLQTQINLRQILNSAISIYAANSNNFPPAAAGTAGAAAKQSLTYVGCFQGSGMPTGNSVSTSAFVAIDLSSQPAGSLSGACDCIAGTGTNYSASAEVQVVRTLGAAPNLVTITVNLLPPLLPGAAPCAPTPSPYGVGKGLTRNWAFPNYKNTPVKQVVDSFDVTNPP